MKNTTTPPRDLQDQPELRFRMFRAVYHGPAAVRGSRIIIHDLRHGKRKTINYGDHGRTFEQATAYLRSIGITVDALGLANKDADCTILSRDMATQLK